MVFASLKRESVDVVACLLVVSLYFWASVISAYVFLLKEFGCCRGESLRDQSDQVFWVSVPVRLVSRELLLHFCSTDGWTILLRECVVS